MVWTARNNGLTGNALNVHHIAIRSETKRLSSENHELHIATDDGVYKSSDGGRSWAKVDLPDPSNAEFGDSPAATVDELTFHWAGYSPINSNTIFIVAAKDSASRIWLYGTGDNGLTWSSRGVTT